MDLDTSIAQVLRKSAEEDYNDINYSGEESRPGFVGYYGDGICDLCLYELVFAFGVETPLNYQVWTPDVACNDDECYQCYVAIHPWNRML
jgi:hypothetical protein